MSGSVGFDSVIHAPNRLQICAFLARVDEAEFSSLREMLDVSDSVLSKHLKVLEDDGVLTTRKVRSTRHPKVWVRLTKAGKQRYKKHVAQLQMLIESQ